MRVVELLDEWEGDLREDVRWRWEEDGDAGSSRGGKNGDGKGKL